MSSEPQETGMILLPESQSDFIKMLYRRHIARFPSHIYLLIRWLASTHSVPQRTTLNSFKNREHRLSYHSYQSTEEFVSETQHLIMTSFE